MKTLTIKNIREEHYTGKVYNLEVEPNHPEKDDQFYICSDNGIVVHNCHPRDNIALRYLSENLNLGYDLFGSLMASREKQAENLAEKLVEEAKKNDLDICIHGKAYKPGVPYTDGSYSLLVEHYLKEKGFEPIYVDPYTGNNTKPENPCVFLMAHSASVTYDYTDKDTRDELYCSIPPGSVVVDPWRKFESSVSKVIHYGNTRLRS